MPNTDSKPITDRESGFCRYPTRLTPSVVGLVCTTPLNNTIDTNDSPAEATLTGNVVNIELTGLQREALLILAERKDCTAPDLAREAVVDHMRREFERIREGRSQPAQDEISRNDDETCRLTVQLEQARRRVQDIEAQLAAIPPVPTREEQVRSFQAIAEPDGASVPL